MTIIMNANMYEDDEVQQQYHLHFGKTLPRRAQQRAAAATSKPTVYQ
jgi:hypothetical protein